MTLGCPNGRSIHNQTSEDAQQVLTDTCSDEEGDDWLTPEGAINEEAEVIIDMGCPTKVHGLHMKNVKMERGGTNQFTIFQSTSSEGPWVSILKDVLPALESPGCGLLHTFNTE